MEQEKHELATIHLKGEVYGLRMVVREDAMMETLRGDLQRLVAEGEHILSGARVVVDFQERDIALEEVSLFLEYFSRKDEDYGQIISWISNNSSSLAMLKKLGFVTGVPEIKGTKEKEKNHKALIYNRSIRSGQSVEHGGDVVILGSVHDGAEVIAQGNVVILGRLQGLVHAGAGGDVGASIFARLFEALQVRIAHKVSYVDQNVRWWSQAALVALEDGVFVVQEMSL